MGTYLNSPNAYTLYRDETTKPYFVDKTAMIGELFPLMEQGSNYICLARPRRFGKTMAAEEKYSEYFGFTEAETDELFRRYQAQNHEAAAVTRDGLRLWYDGYHTKAGERVYNPRSLVAALTNHNLGSYWTSAGPYDEIFYYVEKNIAAVQEDLALMVSGIPVPAKIQEYAATSMKLSTRDEIFSAMVVYGFLSYENGCVRIPNRELMGKFDDMLRKEPALGYVHRLSKESERLLKATREGDTQTMCEVLE